MFIIPFRFEREGELAEKKAVAEINKPKLIIQKVIEFIFTTPIAIPATCTYQYKKRAIRV